ncbi:MAG: Na(+)/H(+) antiporter subunit B [bacterium]
MILVMIISLGLAMLVSAGVAVYSRNLVVAVIASGIIGLFASVIYLILSAPDVAMAEAAIGSGLTTVIFLLALKRLGIEEDNDG